MVGAAPRAHKTAIILAGGLADIGLPEANPLNYVPRITMPFLMLVGRYDTIRYDLGFEASANPLFDLIGTPTEHKVMKVYETDHIPPKSDYISEILSWLDVYLGPVRQSSTQVRRHDAVNGVICGEDCALLPTLQDTQVFAGEENISVARQ